MRTSKTLRAAALLTLAFFLAGGAATSVAWMPPVPSAETVYVTKSGTKYHRAGCQFVKKSKTPLELSQARKTHQPCRVCKPPQ